MLKKTPLPIAGLMLGLAALGNLVMSYGSQFRYALGVMSFIIFLLLAVKIALAPGELRTAFEQPVIASVMPTFSMGMALLSGYIRPTLPQIALVMWFAALVMHLALLVSFSMKYVFNFNIKKVFPSWFIVYVGLATFSVTAPAFGQVGIGQAAFWFALASYLILLPIILYRMIVIKGIPDPALPTIAIFTAPSSLALAGYLNSFAGKNFAIVSLLVVFTLISFVAVMACMPRLLKLPFFPSYSAFTFPFVITGIALKGASRVGIGAAVLTPMIPLFELWAVAMVFYVLWRYIAFFSITPSQLPAQPAQ